MNKTTTGRGFQLVEFDDRGGRACTLQQSSAVEFDYPDAMERPGSSCVWLGTDDRMHLDRDMVRALRDMLTHWLDTGALYASEED